MIDTFFRKRQKKNGSHLIDDRHSHIQWNILAIFVHAPAHP
jgi:hypothetical protein